MMRHSAGRRVRAAFWIAMLAACAAAPAHSQNIAVPLDAFVFRESATLDLWYHGLATIRFESGGPLPYYAVGYAGDQRPVKSARGLAPTPLERHAAMYRREFAADSAFEVLHFVPLYFAAGAVPGSSVKSTMSENSFLIGFSYAPARAR